MRPSMRLIQFITRGYHLKRRHDRSMQQFWGIQVQYTKIWWMLSKMLTTCRSSKCTSITSHGQGGQGAANPHGWWTGCPGAENHGARIQNMKKIWGCEPEFPEIGRFEIGPTSGTTFWSESWHSGPFFIPLWKWAAYPQLSSAFRTSQRAWTPRGWLPIWFHLKQTLAPRGTDYQPGTWWSANPSVLRCGPRVSEFGPPLCVASGAETLVMLLPPREQRMHGCPIPLPGLLSMVSYVI